MLTLEETVKARPMPWIGMPIYWLDHWGYVSKLITNAPNGYDGHTFTGAIVTLLRPDAHNTRYGEHSNGITSRDIFLFPGERGCPPLPQALRHNFLGGQNLVYFNRHAEGGQGAWFDRPIGGSAGSPIQVDRHAAEVFMYRPKEGELLPRWVKAINPFNPMPANIAPFDDDELEAMGMLGAGKPRHVCPKCGSCRVEFVNFADKCEDCWHVW